MQTGLAGQSAAEKSHARPLRREQLECLHRAGEVLEKCVQTLLILSLVAILVDRWRHFSEAIERWLWRFEIAGLCVLGLLWLGRKYYLKDSTRNWSRIFDREHCRAIRKWLQTGEEPFGGGVCLTEFATAASLGALVEMNYEGFKDGAFAIDRERLEERNRSWIERNPRIFMLMRDPIFQRDYIGYSAVVPLNTEGASLYLEGKLKDSDIPRTLICGTEERPAILLLFAIVLKQDFSFSRGRASREYSFYLWGCVRKHVSELYPELSAAGDLPPVYAQAERHRMRDRMKSIGFEPTGHNSADGFGLWVLQKPKTRATAEISAAAATRAPV
jgi:hypothetical protein